MLGFSDGPTEQSKTVLLLWVARMYLSLRTMGSFGVNFGWEGREIVRFDRQI